MNEEKNIQALARGNHVSRVIDSIETEELIASRTLLHPDSYNGYLHYHDNAHFSFVLKGGCAERKTNRYERLPGSLTWYEAGELHQITRVDRPSYHVNFELTASFFKRYDLDNNTIGTSLKQHPDVYRIMLRVFDELDRSDPDTLLSIQQLLLNLVQQSARLRLPGTPAWVGITEQLLADCWNMNLSLDQIAQAAGVHPVTVSRYFQSYFSCTLGQYRRRLKINAAIQRITSATCKLSELAYSCGFADESHFIRAFKEQTGMLPGQLKKLVA